MEKNTGVRKHQARNSEPLNAVRRERLGSTSCYRLTFADEATSVDWNFSGCCGCFGNQGQALTMYDVFAAVFALTQPNTSLATISVGYITHSVCLGSPGGSCTLGLPDKPAARLERQNIKERKSARRSGGGFSEKRSVDNRYCYSKLDASKYPLNKYNPEILFNYRYKQVSLIKKNECGELISYSQAYLMNMV